MSSSLVHGSTPTHTTAGQVTRLGVRWLPSVLTAAAVFILGLPTLILPLHPDQALFALVGREIAGGGFPYVDVWDFKPPGLYLWYALAVQGPFGLAADIRAADLLWTVLTAAVIVELGRRWWSVRAGVIAGLTYGLVWSTAMPWWQSAQPDSLSSLPVMLALLLHDIRPARRGWLVVAGALLGFAFQLRFTVALLIPFFPLVDMIHTREGRARLWVERMLWLGAGFAAFQAALALYLLIGGALGEYIATMRYASGYARQGGPYNPPDGPTLGSYLWTVRLAFWNWGVPRLVLVGPAVVGMCYAVLVVREWRVARLVLFAALVYLGIAVQAKFFWYHYGLIVPVLALICGWTWDRLVHQLREVWPRAVAWGTPALLAGVLTLGSTEVFDSGWEYWRYYLRQFRDPAARSGYFESYLLSARHVADHVRASTASDDTIYVWGFEPLIYVYSERDHASRFLLNFPLMSDWSPESWKQGFINELEDRRPAYFIVERGQTGSWIVGHRIAKEEYIGWYPALRDWLETGYEQETEIDGFILYRRR